MTLEELTKHGIDYALEDDLRSLAGEGPHPLRDAHLESALLRAYRDGQLVTVGGFEGSILAAEARGMERAAESINAIERLAYSASIASCTCLTKSPNIEFHSPGCRYVTLQYIIAQCEDFRAALTGSQP